MYTKAKIKKACKQAHWAALHATCCEYRVVLTEDRNIEVQEWLEGSNSWHRGEIALKTYCYWPYVEHGDGPLDALCYKWLQGEFIRNQLDWDVEDIMEQIKETEEV